ncbi:hypothetical protein DFH08DRAFT_157253 [Mycena albidolilacea]|uniref:Uncharacterized protein n=1 Tax=Mycena albidolilacea TaxID=1033008 RepID=A0AAD7A295_9AGAR|nr:hypothetical protein DFH08DRAFT_157253 [Mycena albidolilacea]
MDTNFVPLQSDADMLDVQCNVSFDLDNLNYRMSNTTPALAWLLPYCWWALLTRGGDSSYFGAPAELQLETLIDPRSTSTQRLPSMSELTENATVPPSSHHPYNITPANIAPETWLGEQLEGLFRNFTMNEDPPQQRQTRKPAPNLFFDKPVLFGQRIRKAPTRPRSSGGTTWSTPQCHGGASTKIVPDVSPLQVSAEEAENIRKLQRESDVCRRRSADVRPKTRRARFEFGYPSSGTFSQSQYSSSHRPVPSTPSSSSSESSSDEEWNSRASEAESDIDDAVSETSHLSDSSAASSWASYSTPNSSARRLSPPPGRTDRLIRMQQHISSRGPGLLQRLVNTIASLWTALV